MANLCNAMIKKGKQINKRQKDLSTRFVYAYERLNYNHRKIAKQLFCEGFCIVPGTFDNKVGGSNPVAETEVEWMESVASDPIGKLRQPQAA